MISNKKIFLANIPFTYMDFKLCPLEQVSIDTLRLINFLEDHGNEVIFADMRSKQNFSWKTRTAGVSSKKKLLMSVASKPQHFLINTLKQSLVQSGEKNRTLDEIWIVCNFSFSPYLFDIDVIQSTIDICRQNAPGVDIKLCGTFADLFSDFLSDLNLKTADIKSEDIYKYPPKISILKDKGYGLFQLSKGCCNQCSFCIAGNQPVHNYDVDETLGYIKSAYEKYGIKEFWNWDENSLLYPGQFHALLNGIIDANLDITINFALGFQPNLISDDLITILASLNLGVLTIPFESGTGESFKRINKPYTIIDSIQYLNKINTRAKKSIKRIQSSFIIGYTHDDYSSIFRIYLSILRLNSMPIPFPLFIFPGTKEYRDNYNHLKNRPITEFHGQLWPLVPEDKVEDYRNLLKFLLIKDLEQAKKNIELLTPEMKKIFFQELKINEYFVEMCLESPGTGYQSLITIEQKLEQCKQRKEKILYISVSPKPATRSVTKELGKYFCHCYQKKNPHTELTQIDLFKEPIGFINEEYIDCIDHKISVEQTSEYTQNLIRLADKYIQLFRRSDKILIATPMYTLSIPGILKTFFELIASRLFYALNDKVAPKQVCCIITRDGVYDYNQKYNLQEKTIEACLNFIGIGTEVDFILAQGFFVKARKDQILNKVKEDINTYIKERS